MFGAKFMEAFGHNYKPQPQKKFSDDDYHRYLPTMSEIDEWIEMDDYYELESYLDEVTGVASLGADALKFEGPRLITPKHLGRKR